MRQPEKPAIWPPALPVSYDHLEPLTGRGSLPNRLAHNVASLFCAPGALRGSAPQFTSYGDIKINQHLSKGPYPITPSSMNDYGTRTRDAAILTGVNRLFEPLTNGIKEALGTEWFQRQHPKARLYGGVILLAAAIRPQPLVAQAGLTARNLQRAELSGPSSLPRSPQLQGVELARCEFPETPPKRPSHLFPDRFELLDGVVEAMRYPAPAEQVTAAIQRRIIPYDVNLKPDAFAREVVQEVHTADTSPNMMGTRLNMSTLNAMEGVGRLALSIVDASYEVAYFEYTR